MQEAQTYLEIIRKRGERGLILKRVYRNLRNRELYLRAYAKLYANQGALTPGTDETDTVDGMSLQRIERIITALTEGTYHWKPVRRKYIPKRNGKLRPLGLPNWSDKLLQEVLRIILSAYYEPQFSNASHGFRSGRGCHTALRQITDTWTGTKWFIEGDIRGCFDAIPHERLLAIISRQIPDQRLLKLLRGMLEAGYLEDWQYYRTYSGTPQGGIISPLLMNIFLNELDQYVEHELIPAYTRGTRRRRNSRYDRLTQALRRAKQQGEKIEYAALQRERQNLPSGDPDDPHYRRLHYVRYADDFLLGFIGPKAEALEIKRKIGTFLNALGLELSEEKTLVTHATTQHARFLGYEVSIAQNNQYHPGGRRTLNGVPQLRVPISVVREGRARYMLRNQPQHRPELSNQSDYSIVLTYNSELQGLVNYYALAGDVAKKLYPVKWAAMQSLVKTLAVKHKRSVPWVYRQYYRRAPQGVMAIRVQISKEAQEPKTAWFGAKPIRHDKRAIVVDTKRPHMTRRNDAINRLLAQQCELCGSAEEVEVHHIHKLKDLKDRYRGRGQPPEWVSKMIALRRKTLVVCKCCHQAIHRGTYDGACLSKVYRRAG